MELTNTKSQLGKNVVKITFCISPDKYFGNYSSTMHNQWFNKSLAECV